MWRDTVVQALVDLGGEANLDELYQAVDRIRANKPPSWQAIVRRELEYNSAYSQIYKGRHNLFASINGIGTGRWGLRDRQTPKGHDLAAPPPGRQEITT